MYMASPNNGFKPTAKPLGGFCNVVPRKESGRISWLGCSAVLAAA